MVTWIWSSENDQLKSRLSTELPLLIQNSNCSEDKCPERDSHFSRRHRYRYSRGRFRYRLPRIPPLLLRRPYFLLLFSVISKTLQKVHTEQRDEAEMERTNNESGFFSFGCFFFPLSLCCCVTAGVWFAKASGVTERVKT